MNPTAATASHTVVGTIAAVDTTVSRVAAKDISENTMVGRRWWNEGLRTGKVDQETYLRSDVKADKYAHATRMRNDTT